MDLIDALTDERVAHRALKQREKELMGVFNQVTRRLLIEAKNLEIEVGQQVPIMELLETVIKRLREPVPKDGVPNKADAKTESRLDRS